VIADHTAVPDSFRGSGAGLAMLTQFVADARAEGFKIMPLCPFVNATWKSILNGRMCSRLESAGESGEIVKIP
jgi:predicted GNAT family acetyltransferase